MELKSNECSCMITVTGNWRDLSMRGLLTRAMESGGHLEMIYMSNKGEITQRVIKVDNINGDSFRAYCFARNRVRTFNISNVLSIGSIPPKYRRGA
jgi:predicted DNA-binding transcriptional regulator YafY